MLSRGRPQNRRHESESGNELSYFGEDQPEYGEDTYPDSDAALLSRHRVNHLEDDHSVHDYHRPAKGVLARFLAFMSRVPLLGSSSSAGKSSSYGALRPDAQIHDYDDDDDDNDDIRKRDRRKASSSAEQNGAFHQGLDSQRSRQSHNRSASRHTARGTLDSRSSNSVFTAEPGIFGEQGGNLRGGRFSTDINDIVDERGGVDEAEAAGVDDNDENDPPDNSPYPQVRASVAATDNISASINTPRMWTLSMLCALLGSATNLFFSLRYPSVAITPVIALVVIHPIGRAWDAILKSERDPPMKYEYGLKIPQPDDRQAGFKWTRRLRLWLSQGDWNEKEHACVYISSNVAFGFAFATDIIVEQHKFYKQDVSIMYQVLLTVSTQILGYSFAGLTRRYLVRPPSMIWPGILMASAMFTTIHSSENQIANGWKVTRLKFFLTVLSIAFAWYFVPGLLMPSLSYFNVITWFAPENFIIANLFGTKSGLGLFPVTFDWAQIAYIGSPLLTPWWAAANVVGGLVVVMWIVAPILLSRRIAIIVAKMLLPKFIFCTEEKSSSKCWSAVKDFGYLPILSSSVFDNTAKPYDVKKILTPDYQFDQKAYDSYSKIYMPITYVLSYGVQFASLTALVTHTACWHGRDIWQQTVKSFKTEERKFEYQPIQSDVQRQKPPRDRCRKPSNTYADPEPGVQAPMSGEDVHNRLMRQYPDAPSSWYLATFISMLAIGIFVVEYYPVHLPWYGLLLALSITAVLYIPVGLIMAITNQHSSLYLICQLICGVVFPGRPVANMVFVTYCYISSAQGMKFSSDLKLGHYLKIPPRLLFSVQLTATIVSALTQILVLNWMFVHIPSLCTEDALNGFTCPLARVHFNGSILWGVVGPARFFGPTALYRPLLYFFPLGLIAPPLFYLLYRLRPSALPLIPKINLALVFSSLSWIPPATGLNFSTWALVCFIFNYIIRRRASAWWGKYTMTLSAGLDSGLAVGVVVVFFAVLYPDWKWVGGLGEWWGARLGRGGCDDRGCRALRLGEGERFDR